MVSTGLISESITSYVLSSCIYRVVDCLLSEALESLLVYGILRHHGGLKRSDSDPLG